MKKSDTTGSGICATAEQILQLPLLMAARMKIDVAVALQSTAVAVEDCTNRRQKKNGIFRGADQPVFKPWCRRTYLPR